MKMLEVDEPSISSNRSALKDFLASIATIRGDLSNITCPPFVLDTKSVTELPAFWAERPNIFCAPAAASEPAQRALLVLKWFLSSLRNQQYAGRDPSSGVKKPLNAFLGELFIAQWNDGYGTTRLVSEQVSHHPPVTACRVWNEDQGVYAEGFTRQKITFTGSVNIQQIGHAILGLEKWDEKYLIPLPNVKVSGILTGNPYPELRGTYYIPSTNGYMSAIEFSGKSLFGSNDRKHSFEAKLYKEGDEEKPLFTVSGHWDSVFTVRDEQSGEELETFDAATAPVTTLQTTTIEEMDDWETRKAWKGVRESLNKGNMQGTSNAKSKVEQGQRQMRKAEERDGRTWQRVFFKDIKEDRMAEVLAAKIGEKISAEDTMGMWAFDETVWKQRKKPYHGNLRPDDTHEKDLPVKSISSDEKANNLELVTANTNATELEKMQQSRKQTAAEVKHVNVVAGSSIDPEKQQQEGELSRCEDGVGGMTLKEQSAVENMLRDQYSSRRRQ